MVKELSIEAIQVGGGGVVAEVGLKTQDGNKMGVRLAIQMKNEPEISEAVTALENAIEAAFVRNLGIGTPVADSTLS